MSWVGEIWARKHLSALLIVERENFFKDLRPLTGSAHSSPTDRPGANLTLIVRSRSQRRKGQSLTGEIYVLRTFQKADSCGASRYSNNNNNMRKRNPGPHKGRHAEGGTRRHRYAVPESSHGRRVIPGTSRATTTTTNYAGGITHTHTPLLETTIPRTVLANSWKQDLHWWRDPPSPPPAGRRRR